MIGEIFSLCAAVFWSLHLIFAKKAQNINKQSANPMDPMVGLFITIFVNNVINALALIIRYGFWPPVPVNSAGLLFLTLAGLTNSFIGRGMLFVSVSMLGAAKAGLTKATAPVFVLLGGVFILGERLGPWNWLGICIVLVGLFLMSFDTVRRESKNLTGTARSDTAGKRADQLYFIKGIAFGLGAALFMGTGNIFRKAGVTRIPDVILAVSVGSLIAMLTCFLVILKQRKFKDMLLAIKKIEFNYAMSGVFASSALYTMVNLLRLIPVSIANSISSTEPLFTILFVWLLKEGKKEKLSIQTLLFGVIMVTGTIILITM